MGTRKRAEGSSRSQHPNFGLRCPLLRPGVFRNLIAISFLIMLASANNGPWTLTTKKSGLINKVRGGSLWKDTSTITVRYHPSKTETNWSENNHKYEKVNGWWKNEWFTMTEMIEHDKENNRINVQISGMQNRWIYYLENDGKEFIEHLRTEEDTVNLGHKYNYGVKPIEHGKFKAENLPMPDELTRGDPANGVYGFRVALQKEDTCMNFTNAMSMKFDLEQYFDAVSVRVYLKNNEVSYIEIPNLTTNKEAHIENIHSFNPKEETVVLGLKDKGAPTSVLGRKFDQSVSEFFVGGNQVADRRLFLGTGTTGAEGKKLLKFLVDHANYEMTDDSKFRNYHADIEADWECSCHSGNNVSEKKAGAQGDRRRLVGAAYYSFIAFNMILMCCLLVGISFAYIGTRQSSRGPVRW